MNLGNDCTQYHATVRFLAMVCTLLKKAKLVCGALIALGFAAGNVMAEIRVDRDMSLPGSYFTGVEDLLIIDCTLTANIDSDVTFAGNATISGENGNLVKDGAGTWTVAGNGNTLGITGISNISVNQGALRLGAGISATNWNPGDMSAMEVASSGTLILDLKGGLLGNNIQNLGIIESPSGVIYGGIISGAGSFRQTQSGLTVFTADQAYTGETMIRSGTLQIGTHDLAGAISAQSSVSVGAVGGLVITNLTGVLSNNIALSEDSFVRADGTGTTIISGAISGSGHFSQYGSGTVLVNGTNTYTGATQVTHGKLIVNGAIAGSAVTVDSGAILSGSGVMTPSQSSGAAITINGTLSPGDTGIGNITLTLAGSARLSFGAGATLAFNIDHANADRVCFSAAPGAGDWLSGAGNLTLALSGSINYADSYVVFQNAFATPASAGFTLGKITGYDEARYTAVFGKAGHDYVLSFVAVPEPGSLAMLIGGLGVLAWMQKRRRR